MAFVIADRIKETTTTIGTGTVNLAGAEAGFQGFAAIPTGSTTHYCISLGAQWEVGLGTFTNAATDTLSRDTIFANSSGDTNPLTLAAGSKEVFCVYSAARSVVVSGTDIQVSNSAKLAVANGGTGAVTLTDGGVLLGSGTGAVTAMGVLADGEIIVGDGTTDPVAESGATARTSLGAAASGANTDITSLAGLTTDLTVAQGGTGAGTFTDGGVLLGAGTGAITAMAVLADSEMIVGDGTTAPVAESGATLRTSIGVGTGNSPQFTGIELGHATDSTITRVSAGLLAVEGNNIALVGTAQEYTRTQNFNATSLTSTTNAVAWVASSNQVVSHTMTENTTFSAPSALVDGAFYNLAIIQDAGASSFTIAFNAVFKFTGGAAPTWTVTANARDYITFRSNGTNLYEVGRSLAVA